MSDERPDEIPPHDRRGFFRASFSRLLRPVADYVEKRLPVQLPIARTLLRPPGAMAERDFLDTCFRCGACADACPAHAISLMQGVTEELAGTPRVDPDIQACVICDELACMKVCPSGALKLVGRLEIRMGLAEVDDGLCVRSKGEDCTICVDRCPIGKTAIDIGPDGRVRVFEPNASGEGCTGCGVCQQHCPTLPRKAIRIRPY